MLKKLPPPLSEQCTRAKQTRSTCSGLGKIYPPLRDTGSGSALELLTFLPHPHSMIDWKFSKDLPMAQPHALPLPKALSERALTCYTADRGQRDSWIGTIIAPIVCRSKDRLQHQWTSFSDRCTGALAPASQAFLGLGASSATRLPATRVLRRQPPRAKCQQCHDQSRAGGPEAHVPARLPGEAAASAERPSLPAPEGKQRETRLRHAEQYANLVAHCKDLWLRAMLETAHNYGWRVSELLTLRVGQVDLGSAHDSA